MATKFFRDNDGNYIGGYDGAEPPVGAIEVSVAPDDARYKWDGAAWAVPPAIQEEVDKEKIDVAALKQGATNQAKLDALWELALGNSKEFDRVKAIIADSQDAAISADPI